MFKKELKEYYNIGFYTKDNEMIGCMHLRKEAGADVVVEKIREAELYYNQDGFKIKVRTLFK